MREFGNLGRNRWSLGRNEEVEGVRGELEEIGRNNVHTPV